MIDNIFKGISGAFLNAVKNSPAVRSGVALIDTLSRAQEKSRKENKSIINSIMEDKESFNRYSNFIKESNLSVQSTLPVLNIASSASRYGYNKGRTIRENGISSIADIFPGGKLAQGIGAALAQKSVSDTLDYVYESRRRSNELLYNEITSLRNKGNKEQADKLERFMVEHNSGSAGLDKAFAQSFFNTSPTDLQVIGSAVELAAFAAEGFSGSRVVGGVMKPSTYKAVKAAKVAKELDAMTRATALSAQAKKLGYGSMDFLKNWNKADRVFKTVLTEGTIGGFGFAGAKAADKGATTDDIVKAFMVGAIIPTATILGMYGLGEGLKKTPKIVKNALDRLDNVANNLKKDPASKDVVDYVLRSTEGKTSLKQRVGHIIGEGVQQARQFESRFIDRFAPINRIEDALMDLKGGVLEPSERIGLTFSQADSVADSVSENQVIELLDNLRPLNDYSPQSRAYLELLDQIDRFKLGQKIPLQSKNPNITLEELNDLLYEMTSNFSPEAKSAVMEYTSYVRQYTKDMMDDLVRAGIKSPEEAARILEAHPNYIPNKVILEDAFSNTDKMSSSLNMGKDVLTKAKGHIEKIKNPIEQLAAIRTFYNRSIVKNNALVQLIDAGKDVMGASKIVGKLEPKEGYETIKFFRNGLQEEWAVPKDIAVAIKNMDGLPFQGFFNFVGRINRLPKQSYTTYNPVFAVKNLARDTQTAAMYGDAMIQEMAERYGLLSNKGYTTETAMDLYSRYVGYGSSIFDAPGMKGAEEAAHKLSQSGLVKVLDSANPLKITKELNEAIERSTRFKLFEKALNQGLDPQVAARVSRESTVDFAKMGSWTRDLNRIIPFLNARIQGFTNMTKRLANSPEVVGRMTLWTTLYPTLVLEQHNSNFDSYGAISQDMKNRYWVIMTGETSAKNKYTGDKMMVPEFIAIPKGEWQALVSMPVQHYLDKNRGIDKRKTKEVIMDMVGSASPISMSPFSKEGNLFSFALYQNPWLATAVGLATGKDIYFDRDIVPEGTEGGPKELQVYDTTPETAKEIAAILNASPAKVDYAISSITGQLGQDAMDLADLAMGFSKGEDVVSALKEQSVSSQNLKTELPVLQAFFKEADEFYGPLSEHNKELRKKAMDDEALRKAPVDEQAEEIVNKLNTLSTKEEKLSYLNSMDDVLTKEVREKIKYIQTSRKTYEAIKKNDSVEVRASYILLRLDEIPNREDKLKFLNELTKKKILTDEVRKKIKKMQIELKTGD